MSIAPFPGTESTSRGFGARPDAASRILTARRERSLCGSRTGKILCVAGDPEQVRGSSVALESAGYAVVILNDGLAAWETLCAEPFDLLIIENELPGISGLEVAARVRRAGFRIPVVIVSNPSELPDEPRLNEIFYSAWLVHPFTPEQLLAIVNSALDPVERKVLPSGITRKTLRSSRRSAPRYRFWGLND